MCLSTVYALEPQGKRQVARNVASVRFENGQLLLTDLMGVTTRLDARVERIDLMDNFIDIRLREDPV